MIKGLPTEVLLLVFVWLEPADLCAVACTCRHWYVLPVFWGFNRAVAWLRRNATTRDGALWFAAMRRASRLDVDEVSLVLSLSLSLSLSLHR